MGTSESWASSESILCHERRNAFRNTTYNGPSTPRCLTTTRTTTPAITVADSARCDEKKYRITADPLKPVHPVKRILTAHSFRSGAEHRAVLNDERIEWLRRCASDLPDDVGLRVELAALMSLCDTPQMLD